MTIKGSLQAGIPTAKAFMTRESHRKAAKNLHFGGKSGGNVKFCFRDPEKHILAPNRVI